jgi:hypothetical protein
MPRLRAPLLFRKVLRLNAEPVQVGHEEAPRAEPLKLEAGLLKRKVQHHKLGNKRPAREAVRLRRISRLIAGFRWFSSLRPTP